MLDTKGPEIRTGLLRDNKPVDLVAGQELLIVTDYSIEGDNKRIACSYKSLPQSVSVGGTIFIADGSLTCEVAEIFEVIIKFYYDTYIRVVSKSSSRTIANLVKRRT
jgi:pyruvate kinase